MNMPNHIAIIMDGNGRWANKKKKPRKFGHFQGTKNIKNLIPFFIKKKIAYLTLFAFGIDNWKRPKSEITYLFFLFQDFFNKNLNYLLDNDVKIKFIGEKKNLSTDIIKLIKKIEKLTQNKNKLTIIIAFNYSSKIEIINSFIKIIKKKNKINFNEKNIKKYLYTSTIPDPDILIRTGGYSRLSNFFLWQISYTELFFLNKFWPDFEVKDLSKIILKYKKIKRNFGSV